MKYKIDIPMHLWKYRGYYQILITLLLIGLTAFLLIEKNYPVYRPLQLYIHLLTDLDNSMFSDSTAYNSKVEEPIIGDGIIAINILLLFVLPVLLVSIMHNLLKFHLIPGEKGKLINAMQGSCSEITDLAREKVSKSISSAYKWINDIRTGSWTDKKLCPDIARRIVESCRGKVIYTTCLQSPIELYSDEEKKQLTEIITYEAIKQNIKLMRILVFNSDPREESTKANKWFMKLHSNKKTKLYWIKENPYYAKSGNYGIQYNQLDIMLFDGRVIYALENDIHMRVIEIEDEYKLFLIDDESMLKKYRNFIDSVLKSNDCKSIINNP